MNMLVKKNEELVQSHQIQEFKQEIKDKEQVISKLEEQLLSQVDKEEVLQLQQELEKTKEDFSWKLKKAEDNVKKRDLEVEVLQSKCSMMKGAELGVRQEQALMASVLHNIGMNGLRYKVH